MKLLIQTSNIIFDCPDYRSISDHYVILCIVPLKFQTLPPAVIYKHMTARELATTRRVKIRRPGMRRNLAGGTCHGLVSSNTNAT